MNNITKKFLEHNKDIGLEHFLSEMSEEDKNSLTYEFMEKGQSFYVCKLENGKIVQKHVPLSKLIKEIKDDEN